MKRAAETKEEISRRFVVRSFWVFGVFVFFSFSGGQSNLSTGSE